MRRLITSARNALVSLLAYQPALPMESSRDYADRVLAQHEIRHLRPA